VNLLNFASVVELVKRRSGIVIGADKDYLVKSRLDPVVKRHGLSDLNEVAEAIKAGNKAVELAVVEAMTTNETSFFRDGKPFDILRDDVFPYLARVRTDRPIRVWSAAASTGQEAYSISILARECGPSLGSRGVEVLGTDISSECIDKARQGEYTQFEVQRGLPTRVLVRYFEMHWERWKVNAFASKGVDFQIFNLLDDMKSLGMFDIILLRNVLIYFDQNTKVDVLNRIADRLHPDGFLFLGGAETVLGVTDRFEAWSQAKGVYVRTDGPLASK
jgi:chemotaxis protein methyltransferase CheR